MTNNCSYCKKVIKDGYNACFLCNRQRKKSRPIIKKCSDCGIEKNSIYKYCKLCFPLHKNDYKITKEPTSNEN